MMIMMRMMVESMEMIKCSGLEKNKEKNKNLKAKVKLDRAILFW